MVWSFCVPYTRGGGAAAHNMAARSISASGWPWLIAVADAAAFTTSGGFHLVAHCSGRGPFRGLPLAAPLYITDMVRHHQAHTGPCVGGVGSCGMALLEIACRRPHLAASGVHGNNTLPGECGHFLFTFTA